MNFLKRRKLALAFIVLSIFEVIIRAFVAKLGNNPDIESRWNVAGYILAGKSVYVSTQFYNYGPFWSYLMGVIRFISAHLGYPSFADFHVAVALFLGTVDVFIAYFLWKLFGKIPALLYIMNPVSILISGFHSQFDNFA